MKVRIIPGPLKGSSVRIPSSKSLSHRALITAALANGTSYIEDLVENKDTEATMRCLEKLGAGFEKKGNETIVHGIRSLSDYDGSLLDCGESGSTLRFLIPLFSLTQKEAVFTGGGKLMERPQSVYRSLFAEQELVFEQEKQYLKVQGALKPGEYVIDGSVSSQFISGLLFALPLLERDSLIRITPPYESRSYVGLTEDALEKAGVGTEDRNLEIFVRGSQTYRPVKTKIEGDDSQAAFFACLSMIAQKQISVKGMAHNSRQGDHQIISVIRNAGGECRETEDGYLFVPHPLKAVSVDLADCPDLGPVLFALASQCEGTSIFTNTQRLRIKESDRIACMEEELRKLGCSMTSDETTVTVCGKTGIRGGVTLNSHNDHRIVMALSVLSLIADSPVIIEQSEAVSKSYPAFFEDLSSLGAKVEII